MTSSPRTIPVEVFVPARCALGEGPIWDDAADELVWVDILGHSIHRCDIGGGNVRTIDVGQSVGCVVPRRGGGLALAVREGFAVLVPGDGLSLIAAVEADRPDTRMNDGACDTAGRFWAGTTSDDATPGAGSLYRLDADGSVTVALRGTTISNGIGWSPDDELMYFVDSLSHGVDVFDFDLASGTISRRRRFIEIPPGDGLPDGLTVDAEGFLWLALWDGWAVHRYAPDGSLDAVVDLPVSRVTSCVFGGSDLSDLFITSAALDRPDEMLAGSVFRCRPHVKGQSTQVYGG